MLPPAYLPIPQPCRKQGLRCRVEEPGRGYFYLGVYVFFFCSSVFLVFARENTISYGFSVISFGFAWFFPRENTIFLRIPCHFLRLFVGFPYGKHLIRFSEGKHTLPWLLLGKIRFS